MTDEAGGRSYDDNDFDRIDDLDAAVDAVTDEHVTERLHQLLADSVLTHLSDLDPNRRHAPTPPAGPGHVDVADVNHLAGLLLATQRQLTIAEGALRAVNTRRAQVLVEVNCAKIRLDGILERIARSSTGADDAYLDTVLDRGQEILAEALENARRIIAAAEAEACTIRAVRQGQASLTAGPARGHSQPH